MQSQSFLAVSTLVSTIITFLCLLIFQISRVTGNMFNNLHSGPISLIFSIMYQYVRLVPQAYQLKVFGAVFSDKIWVYVIAGQVSTRLGFGHDFHLLRRGTTTVCMTLKALECLRIVPNFSITSAAFSPRY